MMGKAKPKKHTMKEIAAKIDAATANRGGGKAGMADRMGHTLGELIIVLTRHQMRTIVNIHLDLLLA
ncbi:hypothetical protein AXF42_Ash015467 [Apostasia shenzhenica]|uniref:Uncharacterized protein n=1 Tax=Apostasia shenzhenica TaxID=1088818 RepID=A0A2H9ZSA8_9ASPA|nr:hypothetical protein AXF42_Ash015467 [Apostasia shenzhenica]